MNIYSVAPSSPRQPHEQLSTSFADNYYKLKWNDDLATTVKKIIFITLSLATFGLFFLALKAHDNISKKYRAYASQRASEQTISEVRPAQATQIEENDATRPDSDKNLSDKNKLSHFTWYANPLKSPSSSHEVKNSVSVDDIDGGAGSQIGYITILRTGKKINLDEIHTNLNQLEKGEIREIIFLLEERLERGTSTSSKSTALKDKLEEIRRHLDSNSNFTEELPCEAQTTLNQLPDNFHDLLLALILQTVPESLYALEADTSQD